MPIGFHQVGQAWDGKRGRHCLFLLLAVCGYKAGLWASGGRWCSGSSGWCPWALRCSWGRLPTQLSKLRFHYRGLLLSPVTVAWSGVRRFLQGAGSQSCTPNLEFAPAAFQRCESPPSALREIAFCLKHFESFVFPTLNSHQNRLRGLGKKTKCAGTGTKHLLNGAETMKNNCLFD